jgi:hypothetical protein
MSCRVPIAINGSLFDRRADLGNFNCSKIHLTGGDVLLEVLDLRIDEALV